DLDSQALGVGAERAVLHFATIDTREQRQQHEIKDASAGQRDGPDDKATPANGAEEPLGDLVHLHHAHDTAAFADHGDVHLGENGVAGAAGALGGLLTLVERLDLDGDLPAKRLLKIAIVGKALADQLGLVGPDD